MTLSDTEVAALIPGSNEGDLEEQLARTPRANQLAYTFVRLWSKQRAGGLRLEEELALRDAVDGLRRCCFRAIGQFYSAPTDVGATRSEATAEFIEDRLLTLLTPFVDLPEQELQALALAGRFKHLPREVRFDLYDRIRKEYSRIERQNRAFLRIRINRRGRR